MGALTGEVLLLNSDKGLYAVCVYQWNALHNKYVQASPALLSKMLMLETVSQII